MIAFLVLLEHFCAFSACELTYFFCLAAQQEAERARFVVERVGVKRTSSCHMIDNIPL